MNIIDVTAASAGNIPEYGNGQRYIAVHYLGVVGQNNKIDAGGYGSHFYIYWDGTVYQAAPLNAVLWQVGTAGYYTQKHPYANNYNVVGIEMCPKCDGNASNAEDPYWYFTQETQNSCVELVKYLMGELGVGADHVLRHYDIVNKWCPAPYCNNNGYNGTWTWNQFKEKLTGSSSISPSPSKPSGNYKTGIYQVNESELNIRSGPGVNYNIVGSITDMGQYTITEIQNTSWGRLKSGAGWINVSSSYCTYCGDSSSGSETVTGNELPIGEYRVVVDALSIRSGPAKTTTYVGSITDKGIYTITEVQNTCWGKLKSGAGWICIDPEYCILISDASTPTTSVSADTVYSFFPSTVTVGSHGLSVLLLQEILSARGYYSGNLDREAGSGTVSAIQSYQNDRKSVLSVDGSCGESTWNDLLALEKQLGEYVVKQISYGSNCNDVLLLQEILKARGYYTGALDRSFGNGTKDALIRYQTDRKSVLAIDGVCGPNTWRDLIAL